MTPRLSVIIPTYLEEKTIGRLLSRFSPALCERYALEIIVSDAGSTDATLSIVESFAHSLPIRTIVHTGTHRQTIAEGRNAGAQAAQGAIFVFLNSDTILQDPDRFFQIIMQWAESDPSTVALVPRVFVDPQVARWYDVVIHWVLNAYIAFLNAVGIGACRGEAQIVRSEAFWQVGGYNPDLAAGEDFDLYRRLAQVGKIRFEPRLVVYEDPRRYRRYGYAATLWLWTVNTLSIWLRKRAVSQEWKPIR